MNDEKIVKLEKRVLELERQIVLYQQMFKRLPQQVWVLKSTGDVLFSTDSLDLYVAEITQQAVKDLTGSNIYHAFEKLAPKPLIEMLRKNDLTTKQSNRTMIFEETVKIKGGEKVFLSYKRRFIDPKTKDVYIIGMSFDITEKKLAETKMATFMDDMKIMNDQKKGFIESFRHDLQTPISNILGIIDLLPRSSSKEDQSFFIESIKSSAMNLQEYVKRLDVTEVDKSKHHPVESLPVNLHNLLANVMSGLQVFAKTKALSLDLEVASTVPEIIHSDQMRLYRVLINLMTNAIKYTVEGGVLLKVFYVETDQGGLLEMHIEDTGVGIDPSFQQAIFSPLMRVYHKATNESEGSGLGLSIAKGFVDDMMGQISVNSQPGQGSTFTVMIPIGLNFIR